MSYQLQNLRKVIIYNYLGPCAELQSPQNYISLSLTCEKLILKTIYVCFINATKELLCKQII